MDSAILYTGYVYAFAAGLFGTTFFMIVDLQSKIESSSQGELRDMWTFRMILLRCSFGVGAATILYFFFQTGLLGDGVWPDVGSLDFAEATREVESGPFRGSTYRLPNTNTSLLIVWSFLAGYSQTFVPRLLVKTTNKKVSQV
ncbi:MAG: hypothetical protein AB8B64_04965 [Granulosicoccus sp.]